MCDAASTQESEAVAQLDAQLDAKLLRRYFLTLRGALPAELESLSPQRWLLLYFSLVGDLAAGGRSEAEESGGPVASDSDIAAAILETQVERDEDERGGAGGFRAFPDAAVHTPSATGTHCALLALRIVGHGGAWGVGGFASAVAQFFCRLYVPRGAAAAREFPALVLPGAFRAAPGAVEADVRFTYSAVASLALLSDAVQQERQRSGGNSADDGAHPMGASPGLNEEAAEGLVEFVAREWGIDLRTSIEFLLSCQTYEGGFGGLPGLEAHGGMTFCAAAALALLGALHQSDVAALRRYCCARLATFDADDEVVPDTAPGALGFQGRTNKDCDTCYTFWFGCTLELLGAAEMVDTARIAAFVSACQCAEMGGVCKNACVTCDPMHSCLGVTGLAALCASIDAQTRERLGVAQLARVDPLLGVPRELTEKWGVGGKLAWR